MSYGRRRLYTLSMSPAITPKDQLRRVIDEQPDDSSFEEIIKELAFAAMVERGLADAQAGRTISHERIDTIADGIGVRVPVPEALDDLQGLVDELILVSDDAILRAMRLLHRHAGMVAEPSGAAGLAALVQEPARFAGQTVGTIMCGSNLTPAQMRDWLAGPS